MYLIQRMHAANNTVFVNINPYTKKYNRNIVSWVIGPAATFASKFF